MTSTLNLQFNGSLHRRASFSPRRKIQPSDGKK